MSYLLFWPFIRRTYPSVYVGVGMKWRWALFWYMYVCLYAAIAIMRFRCDDKRRIRNQNIKHGKKLDKKIKHFTLKVFRINLMLERNDFVVRIICHLSETPRLYCWLDFFYSIIIYFRWYYTLFHSLYVHISNIHLFSIYLSIYLCHFQY